MACRKLTRYGFRALGGATLILAATTLGCSDTGQDAADVATSESEHGTDGSAEHSHDEGGEHEHGEAGEHREEGEHGGGEHEGGERGEHDRDGEGQHGHGEEGEESGDELSLTDAYDNVGNGARLVLAYDSASNAFKGTVENTTQQTLERVRVEVHLSNGKELGPTKPGDLKPGEKREITLAPESKNFDGWTAHPEVGNEEHGHGEGGGHAERERGEHDREGGGEH